MNESDANRVQDTEETSGVRDSPTHVRSGADFPSTNHGWIGTQLALGEVGRAAVVQHVMSSYAVPL